MDRYQLGQAFRPKSDGSWTLRQGYVVSDDGGTVTVTIAGSDVPVSGVRYLGSAPTPSEGCWLMVSGTDLFVLGQLA